MLGIGDGEFLDPALGDSGLEIGEFAVRLQWRAVRHDHHDAADRVKLAGIRA